MQIRNAALTVLSAGAIATGGVQINAATDTEHWYPLGINAACSAPAAYVSIDLYTDQECSQELLAGFPTSTALVHRVAGPDAPQALLEASKALVDQHGPEWYLRSALAVYSAHGMHQEALAQAVALQALGGS